MTVTGEQNRAAFLVYPSIAVISYL